MIAARLFMITIPFITMNKIHQAQIAAAPKHEHEWHDPYPNTNHTYYIINFTLQLHLHTPTAQPILDALVNWVSAEVQDGARLTEPL